jgi:large subunit ribosomal protein L1
MAEAKKIEKEVNEEVATSTTPSEEVKEVKTAKAGKRSAKSQAEVIEKEAKEAKKTESAEEATKKIKQKPRVKKYSKNQKAARELIDSAKLYSLKESIELLPKISKTKFDASAEIHVTLNIDPRQADQIVRTTTSLPAGTGKTLKVAVIAGEKEAESAKKAVADMADADVIIKDISKEKIAFDVLIATPDKMAELGKLAKVLGPKGLMPSPKNGTVTADPAKATEEFKKGKVEIKNDANGVIHVAFGKVSFKAEDLYANAKAVVKALSTSKPSGVKGVFIKNVFVNSSMSPSIRVDQNEALKESK